MGQAGPGASARIDLKSPNRSTLRRVHRPKGAAPLLLNKPSETQILDLRNLIVPSVLRRVCDEPALGTTSTTIFLRRISMGVTMFCAKSTGIVPEFTLCWCIILWYPREESRRIARLELTRGSEASYNLFHII